MTARDRRRLNAARTCYACRLPIPATQGVYHAALGILVHQGICTARVVRASRDYDRSARGRQVPRREVLRRLETGHNETTPNGSRARERAQTLGGQGSWPELLLGTRAQKSY